MEKAAVIAIRDALIKNGKTNPIKVVFDNGPVLQLSSDLVFWDDTKEIVVGFVMDPTSGSLSADMPYRVVCSTYENIQFIMANSSVEDLDKLITSLSSVVTAMSGQKDTIKKYLKNFTDPDIFLSKKEYLPVDIIRDKTDNEESDKN